MNLKNKRKLAARLLDVGSDRIWVDSTKINEVKEAITKDDLRSLLSKGSILVKPIRGISRGRIRKSLKQKRKGRRVGPGTRKGKKGARLSAKRVWMNQIRAQRNLFSDLRGAEKVSQDTYRMLRKKARGGFFRSTRHIKLYLTEHNLWIKKK